MCRFLCRGRLAKGKGYGMGGGGAGQENQESALERARYEMPLGYVGTDVRLTVWSPEERYRWKWQPCHEPGHPGRVGMKGEEGRDPRGSITVLKPTKTNPAEQGHVSVVSWRSLFQLPGLASSSVK